MVDLLADEVLVLAVGTDFGGGVGPLEGGRDSCLSGRRRDTARELDQQHSDVSVDEQTVVCGVRDHEPGKELRVAVFAEHAKASGLSVERRDPEPLPDLEVVRLGEVPFDDGAVRAELPQKLVRSAVLPIELDECIRLVRVDRAELFGAPCVEAHLTKPDPEHRRDSGSRSACIDRPDRKWRKPFVDDDEVA